MKNILITCTLLAAFGLTSMQVDQGQDTLKRKKTQAVTEHKKMKVVNTKDQKKVIRRTTSVKSDTVLAKPAN